MTSMAMPMLGTYPSDINFDRGVLASTIDALITAPKRAPRAPTLV